MVYNIIILNFYIYLLIRFLKIGKWEVRSTANKSTSNKPLVKDQTGSPQFLGYLQRPLFPSINALYDDFQGRRLLVAVVSNWPFFKLSTLPDKTVVPDSGIDLQVITALSRRLNFTYRVVVPEDGRWGGPEANGNVSGMIGMVANHRAHVAIDEITITDIRETVVDFTRPYYIESSTLVSRAPTRKDSSLAIFHPFTPLSLLPMGEIAIACRCREAKYTLRMQTKGLCLCAEVVCILSAFVLATLGSNFRPESPLQCERVFQLLK
ncbi:hypothetical protein SK128_011266 [Halocaridina rubra]|uniref:Ionotropic glutamate receptor L-glutamate and glycine-binding domain-containing protein n=1 Tax=Halocaridina rubra TaxID=373956 RepID=A0AAN8XH54_HALRR